ncbi:barstar family protein [Streptomyces sp. NBC_00019]|uniref:barstar family protein n=1 Tax=Streptomyces sp. NBC_00019 TaxID=2975623 RepID=UPI003247F5FC
MTGGAGPLLGPSLTRRRPPWAVFTSRNDPWGDAETARLLERAGRVFRLDGRELRELKSLFSVFARELGFPGYFGHNWDALVDCLHDRHDRHDRQDVAVLIDHADSLLDVDFLGVFVSVLCQAAWRANLQLDADGVPDPDWKDGRGGVDGRGRLVATLAGDDWPVTAQARLSGNRRAGSRSS